MIKAEELRLNNIVKSTPHKGLVTEISSLSPVDLKLWANPFAMYRYDDIEGVPLDEDWLIKFNLYVVENADYGFEGPHGQEYVIEQQGDFWFIGIKPDTSQTVYFVWDIYFVHHLQNLYYALTGTELTINPK